MAANGGFAQVPKHVDTSRANPARCYDYWLGGSANFSVDRELADEMIRREPNVVHTARENRSFLGRAVRWCVDNGITQFLDLGSGIPTVGNVHESAQQRDPSARVAYVDNEPVAVAHSQQLLSDNPRATVTSGDLREPGQVLSAPTVREVLDFDRPVALLAVMMLHYFQDDEVLISTLARYREALPAGSYLVLTHLTEDDPEMDMSAVADESARSTHPAHPRTREQFRTLFEGTLKRLRSPNAVRRTGLSRRPCLSILVVVIHTDGAVMPEASAPSTPPPSPEGGNLVMLLREVRRDIDDATDRIPQGCYRSEEYNELADTFGQLSELLRRRALLRLVGEVGPF